MSNLSKTSKLFLVILFVSYALWLGSYIGKNLIFFEFFDPKTMELRGLFTHENLLNVFYAFYPVITLNIICYPIFLIAFFIFLFTSRLNLRNNGWLFISLLVIIITLPLEAYLIFKYDIKIIMETAQMTIQTDPAIALLKERVTKFGMYSFINIFSTISIVAFFIFRPLTKK